MEHTFSPLASFPRLCSQIEMQLFDTKEVKSVRKRTFVQANSLQLVVSDDEEAESFLFRAKPEHGLLAVSVDVFNQKIMCSLIFMYTGALAVQGRGKFHPVTTQGQNITTPS